VQAENDSAALSKFITASLKHVKEQTSHAIQSVEVKYNLSAQFTINDVPVNEHRADVRRSLITSGGNSFRP
jgi:hypothetical protein